MALSTSTVSYWKFDTGNSNDSVTTNNGTDHTIAYSTGNGKLLEGAGFNGTSSYINFGDVSGRYGATGLANSSNSLTFSVWAKQTTKGVAAQIFQARAVAGNNQGVDLFMTSGNFIQIRFSSNGGAQQFPISSGTFTDTTSFHHIVAVYDASAVTITVYFDGVVVTGLNAVAVTETWSLGAGAGNLDVGAFGSFASTNWFPGAMDEIGLWSRALSATEVTQLWANGGARQWPFGQNFLPMM